MTRPMEWGPMCTEMELVTLGSGSKINSMATELKRGKTDLLTKEATSTPRSTAQAHLNGQIMPAS